jgi:hypothetical protein
MILELRIRLAYAWYRLGIATSPIHPALRFIGKAVPAVVLPLFIGNFIWLFTVTDNPLYFQMAFVIGVFFVSAYVVPGILYIERAVRNYSADSLAYEVDSIYVSPRYSAMVDEYWRKRLYRFPEGQYVYILRDASVTGYYKIGKTNNPARRIGRFDVTLPFAIQIISIMPCTNMHNLEAKLHRMCHGSRMRGEWFKLGAAELPRIIALEAKLLFVEPIDNGQGGQPLQ